MVAENFVTYEDFGASVMDSQTLSLIVVEWDGGY